MSASRFWMMLSISSVVVGKQHFHETEDLNVAADFDVVQVNCRVKCHRDWPRLERWS